MISNIGLHLKPKKQRLENNMLIHFTDASTNNSIAVNINQLVCVFTIVEDGIEKTILNMFNGNLAIKKSYLEAVGRINGEMK